MSQIRPHLDGLVLATCTCVEAQMRTAAAIVVFVGLVASPLLAQEPRGWYGDRVQGIPPGQLPAPGQCRVWYDNRPAGRQPRATSCVEAERAAARDSRARVIYGDNRDGRRAVPRGYPSRSPYPAQYPNGRAGYGYGTVPFDNGYKDGYDKGREDARDNDSGRSSSPRPLSIGRPRLRSALRNQGAVQARLPAGVR